MEDFKFPSEPEKDYDDLDGEPPSPKTRTTEKLDTIPEYPNIETAIQNNNNNNANVNDDESKRPSYCSTVDSCTSTNPGSDAFSAVAIEPSSSSSSIEGTPTKDYGNCPQSPLIFTADSIQEHRRAYSLDRVDFGNHTVAQRSPRFVDFDKRAFYQISEPTQKTIDLDDILRQAGQCGGSLNKYRHRRWS